MEKIEITAKVNYYFDWSYKTRISKIREDLDALEKLGATYINIDPVSAYGEAHVEMTSFCQRFETDQEYEDRLELKEKLSESNKQKELDTLARLKAKYDNKPSLEL